MTLAVLHRQEVARLRLLEELALLDAPPDPALEALVRRSAALTGADGAMFSLMTATEQWVVAALGTARQRSPRHPSPCGHVVAHDAVLALGDAAADIRFAAAAMVRVVPGLRAYVGAPIRVRGLPVGTLCTFSCSPGRLPADTAAAIEDLALAAGALLEARHPPSGVAVAAPVAARPGSDTDAAAWPTAAVLAAVPDLWFVLDEHGRYMRCCAEHHPSLVRPFADLRGRVLTDTLPEPARGSVAAALLRARATRTLQVVEYSLTVADGRLRRFETRISPMAGSEFLYLARDVTEAHEAARDAALMQRAFEAPSSLPVGIAEAGGEQALVYVNSAFEALYGLPRQQVLGLPLLRVLDPAAAAAGLRAAAARGIESTHTLRSPRADGSTFTNELSLQPVHDDQGRLTHLVSIHRDVTERDRAAEAQRGQQAAELARRSKSEFLSRMSHEMRTPLNAIIGFSQLMKVQPALRVDHVDHVLSAGQHLLALVDDVLDLQQVEAGQAVMHAAPVPLAPLAKSLAAALTPMAEARSVHLAFHGLDDDTVAWADERRLRQVLLNIGSNAIKYNRPAGVVRLTCGSPEQGTVEIVVEDTGPGLTTDQLARLFQPFERLGRETSSVEGTGLGLLLSRQLLAAMGGQLDISSVMGRGTRVTIRLPSPAPRDADVAAAPAGPAGPAAPAAAMRLLYVEDNRINAMLFEQAIRMHTPFELRLAEDGPEALEIARDWVPDVLILDANLPGDDGYAVLEHLRRLPGLATAPAFMCSADAMASDLERARAAGFRGYWPKPVDIDAVVADLHRIAALQATHH